MNTYNAINKSQLSYLFSFQAMAEDSVYGLYGDLLNLRDYECDSTDLGRVCQENHRSDPELDTIPYRVSTLDRRVTMKSQRPRSDIFFSVQIF